jgi:hypothetical protein
VSVLTRQHFRLLANALADSLTHGIALARIEGAPYATGMAAQYKLCCASVALALATTNPKFDTDQFMAACGLHQSESRQ